MRFSPFIIRQRFILYFYCINRSVVVRSPYWMDEPLFWNIFFFLFIIIFRLAGVHTWNWFTWKQVVVKALSLQKDFLFFFVISDFVQSFISTWIGNELVEKSVFNFNFVFPCDPIYKYNLSNLYSVFNQSNWINAKVCFYLLFTLFSRSYFFSVSFALFLNDLTSKQSDLKKRW